MPIQLDLAMLITLPRILRIQTAINSFVQLVHFLDTRYVLVVILFVGVRPVFEFAKVYVLSFVRYEVVLVVRIFEFLFV